MKKDQLYHIGYWIVILSSYAFSFITGLSIGLYALSLTFILLALYIAGSFGWLKKTVHLILTVGIGVFIWWIAISTIDDYWLFFPFVVLMKIMN